MKTLRNILIAITFLTSLSIGFISCLDDPILSDLGVSLEQNKSIVVNGDTVKITITATTANDKITTITAVKTGGSALTVPAVTDNKDYSGVINYVVNDADGEIEFTVTVSSENSVDPIVKTVKVTVVSAVAVTLGAKTSPLPSFVNGTTLNTYTSTEAFANQALVDLVYTFSTADGAIIGAPSDAAFVLASWTTKNATKIGKITEMTPAAISAVSGTVVKNLAVGDMLGYITTTGTNGIIKVTAIVVSDNGNVTLSFMVIK